MFTSLKKPLSVTLSLLAAVSGLGAGTLVIGGGAVSPDNLEIYGPMVERLRSEAAPFVAVVPTGQSRQITESRVVDAFNRHFGSPVAEIVPIFHNTPQRASDPQVLAQLERAQILYFLGGSQTRILNVFCPDGVDSPAMKILREKLASNGWVGGSSAGAAMMPDPMLSGGRSNDAFEWLEKRDSGWRGRDGVRIQPGMGIFPYGIIDQHFVERGRLGRLVVALHTEGITHGYGINENRALITDVNTGKITAVGGKNALILVDMGGATVSGTTFEGVRISLLSSGDTVDGPSARPTAAAGKSLLDQGPVNAAEVITERREPWERHVAGEMLERLAFSPAGSIQATNATHRVVFSRDERTRILTGPDRSPDSLTIIDLRMDVIRR